MCMADYADNEGGVSLGSETRKARKIHRCNDCSRNIAIGEAYHVGKWACDGTVETFRMCAHCRVAADWLTENCGGYLWGGILEDISEHVEEYRGVYPDVTRDLKRLHVQACHHWRFRRGPCSGSLLPIPKMPRFPATASKREAKS
jgi:hypothetical protein